MRLHLIILALAACSTLGSTAQAQRYNDDDDRGPPRYDRGPPPRDDYYRQRDYDRPQPRFTCFVAPVGPYPGRSCGTPPGRPGSPCKCGPYFGVREIDRRY